MTEQEVKALIETEQGRWIELHDKHFIGLTDISIIVLKGHLLVEQLLNSLLSRECHSPGELRKIRLRFPQKVALVKAIVFLPFPDELWGFLELINQLRNDIAHELEPEFKGHLKNVRAMTKAQRNLAPEQIKPTFDTDEGSLSNLISFWLGVLGAIDSTLALIKANKLGQTPTTERANLP
jgi:hypothetical protein